MEEVRSPADLVSMLEGEGTRTESHPSASGAPAASESKRGARVALVVLLGLGGVALALYLMLS